VVRLCIRGSRVRMDDAWNYAKLPI